MNVPDTPRGLLRVSAPYVIGKHQLLPLLPEFRSRYPEVELDLRLEDRPVDLVKEAIDVSIGIRLDPGPGLIGKRLTSSRMVVAASRPFLEQYGVPQHPRDLLRCPCIRYRVPAADRAFLWHFVDPVSETSFTLDPPAAITASGQEIAAELAVAHQGIALLGLNSVQSYLRSGSLVEVLREYSHALPPMMIFYTSKEDMPSRVRAFIDFVTERLADRPPSR